MFPNNQNGDGTAGAQPSQSSQSNQNNQSSNDELIDLMIISLLMDEFENKIKNNDDKE